MENIDEIKKIINKITNEKVYEINFIGQGACNKTFYACTETKKLLIKLERSDKLDSELNNITTEHKVLKELQKKNSTLFLNTLDSKNKKILIYDFFDGKNLELVKQTPKLFYEIGIYLRDIHEIFKTILIKEITKEKIDLKKRIKIIVKKLEKIQDSERIISFLQEKLNCKELFKAYRNSSSYFIHGDIHKGNILINTKGDIKIIDYGDARISNIYEELSIIYKQFPDFIEYLLEGFLKNNRDEINLETLKLVSLIKDIEKTMLYHEKRLIINRERIIQKLKESPLMHY